MSIYNLNTNILWQQLNPPLLRNPAENDWGKSLLSPLQYDNDLYVQYIYGSSYSLYDNSIGYVPGDRVIGSVGDSDRTVYENIIACTASYPPNSNWVVVNDNYIGAEERSKYKAQKYLYEYALNKWFMVPNIGLTSSYGASYSNIYIQTNIAVTNRFLMGRSGIWSDVMDRDSRFSSVYMGRTYTPPTLYDYTVMVPSAVVSASVLEISAFCDMVNIAGMQYQIQFY